jgi:hypothetical protein
MQTCREELNINFSYENLKKVDTTIIRNKYNSCCYCGDKYQIRPVSVDQHIDVACNICYAITHLNKYESKEFIIATSKLSQLEIKNKTLAILKKEKKLEYIKKLDPSAKIINVSISELEILFKHNKEISNQWKVFFNNDFKEIKKYVKKIPSILRMNTTKKNIKDSVPDYIFSKKEKYYLDEVFYKNIKLTQSGYEYYLNLLKEAPDLAN